MVLDLKFARLENVPWGFRLTGGNDFELPLTVIKVREGTIAEEAGLKVGDVIVRINDTPTSNLSHSEAHEIIMECANTFVLGVLRPDEDGCLADSPAKGTNELESNEQPQTNGFTNGTHGTPSPYRQFQTPDSQAYSDMSEMTIHTESVSDEAKTDEITDEHIAEMMSGEAEVLKEHNVIGVNFNRIIPKAGLFKSSEVFKHLNEEAMKTKADKDQETKKWTTFLQKPNRPVPKSRLDLERERQKAQGYKIKICKQPKPRCDPNRPPTPVPVIEPEPEPEVQPIELIPGPEPQYVEYLNETIVESDVPATEDQNTGEAEGECQEEVVKDDTGTTDTVESVDENTSINTPPKTEEEILIEKQLAEVQRQLLALSSLPSTIQATLDAVTKQLAELMPTLKQTGQTNASDVDVENGLQGNSDNFEYSKVDENDGKIETQTDEVRSETKEDHESETDIVVEEIVDEEINENAENEESVAETVEDDAETTQETIEKQRMEKVFKKQEEEWLDKKEKERKRLEAEEAAKRRFPRRLPKELGGPLTPQERPVVLPGGRKWRNERDAFNEDFIAEVISSQAELITGSTLGINFLKYKKPEKDLSNLNRSEVFRIIHNIEKDPKHGIQVRPPKVLAEEDVRSVKFTMSTTKDKRIMSFVDTLWGFEVTGGYDQYEPLTVLEVRRSGYAFRAGIRVNDRIVQINETMADALTLREAQLLIRQSGKQVKIYVKGDTNFDEDDEYTVDFWFKPPRKKIHVVSISTRKVLEPFCPMTMKHFRYFPTQENQWGDCFPWNDKKKKIYRESNCFMVPSKAEEKLIERMLSGRGPVIITQSKENVVDKYEDMARQQAENTRQQEIDSSAEIAMRQRLAEAERDLAKALRAHTPTTDESNVTMETTASTTTESTNLIGLPGKGR
ncbi:hypothetical protein HA402_002122 [Bradysia odoriphaga]|nr:hypothetical protein HA402_002122 [Bradysia odoriphaga]